MAQHSTFVCPLLTDLYQLTMSYSYWKTGKADEPATFELFFRSNPFQGQFTVFAGLADCIEHLKAFRFTTEDVAYLKQVMPSCTDSAFFDYLLSLRSDSLSLWSVEEGSVVFPREPILQVQGPLIICQLLESTLLNLINYASLLTTNTARFRLAVGSNKGLFEFGLRRAQGPDGALSASRYAYLGGCDGTSNVLAGKLFSIPVVGTHAHSFISVYQDSAAGRPSLGNIYTNTSDDTNVQMSKEPNSTEYQIGELRNALSDGDHLRQFPSASMTLEHLAERCVHWSRHLSGILQYPSDQVHPGELIAFANYAYSFPSHFIGLIDTYHMFQSGLPNFCATALALHEFGFRAVGVRIDSGDLALSSLMIRQAFEKVGNHYKLPWFKNLRILVSNDLNEDTIHSFNQHGHSIDVFCVGTHLVTCQKQPALGCVYKLVEIAGNPTMKLSSSVDKMTLPGRKRVFRLYSKTGEAILDLLQFSDESAPKIGERILCRHPNDESKRVFVIAAKVEEMLKLYWDKGKLIRPPLSLAEAREQVNRQLSWLRSEHKNHRSPAPYKVSLSERLYEFTHDLLLRITPITEIR